MHRDRSNYELTNRAMCSSTAALLNSSSEDTLSITCSQEPKIDLAGLLGLAVQIEPAVVDWTLRALVGQRTLGLVACTCTWLHTLALVAAEAFIKLSISCQTGPVCKWRRDYPARMAPLEAHHMADASRYIGCIAGRYQLFFHHCARCSP